MNPHESYEVLCALVASGEASLGDIEQLQLHLRECADCRGRLSDFTHVSALALPLYGETYRHRRVPSRMTTRFIERARGEGIPLERALQLFSRERLLPWLAWGAAAAIVIVIGGMVIRGVRSSLTARPESPPTFSHVFATPPKQNQEVSVAAESSHQMDQLRAQLMSAQQEVGTLEEKLAAMQLGSNATDFEKTDLLSRLSALEKNNTTLRLQLISKDSQLAELNNQFKHRDLSIASEATKLAERQAELDRMDAELSVRQVELERQRQVLAASAQARDLITARNLHIIDVHDNDRSGPERPFGRIFYTEGRSLIFYAYDLNASARQDTKISFHVWGGTLGNEQLVKKLGTFRLEDSMDGRWVLTCDDSRVLAQINTVFVTIESGKNRLNHPKGKRILYAFLGDRPNHP